MRQCLVVPKHSLEGCEGLPSLKIALHLGKKKVETAAQANLKNNSLCHTASILLDAGNH